MSPIRHALTAAGLVIVVGACAPLQSITPTDAVPQPTVAAAQTPVAAPSDFFSAVQKREAAAPLDNPLLIAFDENTSELGEEGKQLVLRLVEEAGGAGQIVLTGFCDRNVASNAREVAIARAVAVKEALQTAGVRVSNFRIKYRTVEPKHAVQVSWAR
jgi:outer membrane protein OmpA-like peptidoglycan-associated protein